jgi:hypothetical protein
MNAAKSIINEYDLSSSASSLLQGIICVEGITKRGPIDGTLTLIKSWPQFEKLFGGLLTTSDFPLYCKLLLEAGVTLRVKRIMSTANVVTSKLPIVTGSIRGIGDSGTQPLFNLVCKYPGSDYNNLSVVISAASNGQANYFNLSINHSVDGAILNEKYENLTITGKPTVANSSYLSDVAAGSQLVNVVYYDLSALTGSTLRPVNGTSAYSTGANGDAVVPADYVSGASAFDGITDSITLMAPEIDIVTGGAGSNPTITGLADYVATRKNMDYVAHYSNSILTAADLVTARLGLGIDNSYFHCYAGGVKWVDPATNVIKNLSGLSHIGITMTRSDEAYGEQYSYAGLTRGTITNVVGPVNNFSNAADLDTLANAQINVIIRKNNKTVIWGNFTGQYSNSKLSQISVRRFLNKLKLELTPVLERYLEEPNEPTSWKNLYYEVKPLLDAYKSASSRALNDYEWQGDQFVKSVTDVTVNTLEDINQGKYKVKLPLDIVNAIREITLGIYVTKSGATLTEI